MSSMERPASCQAKVDGVDGKIAGVLFAAEALLLGGGDQFAVDHQRGGRVHPLRNAVLALVETRPMACLKGIAFSSPLIPITFIVVSFASSAPAVPGPGLRRAVQPPANWGGSRNSLAYDD